MFVLVASLLLAASSPAATTPVIPDTEVVRYLRGAEVAEWSRACHLFEAGRGRLNQGTSIMNAPRTQSVGKGFETPAEAKARGEALVKEGQEQIQRATQTLNRLRSTAATRFAELTKEVSLALEVSGYRWEEGLLMSALRAQKLARDAGMTAHHVIGAWNFGDDGKPAPNATLVEDLRAAWTKAQAERKFLEPAPSDGYRITAAPTAEAPAQFSATWTAPTAANQVALVWAEIYPINSTASLVYIHVADAHSLRLIDTECFLTSPQGDAVGFRASITLQDRYSFVPRISASDAWRLGYPLADCTPIGAAMLRHLSVRGNRVPVWCGEWLSRLLGGTVSLDDKSNALWKVKPVPGVTGDFKVSATQVGTTKTIEVGTLSLRLEQTKSAKTPPAAK